MASLLVLGLLHFACARESDPPSFEAEDAEATPVVAVSPERRSLQDVFLEREASLLPVSTSIISTHRDGFVHGILPEVGDIVNQGDLVAEIDQTDAAKREMAKSMETTDPRVLNRIGAFATLIDASFPGIAHPVLVHKSEEPGSKQKLAFAHGRHRSVCYDMVNHLIDDIIVMGAEPVSIQDVIVCGTLEGTIASDLVDAMDRFCDRFQCGPR